MKKTFVRVVALTAVLSLVSVNAAFAGGSIGHGDISVLNDQGTIITKLSGQNPVEDGTLLACDGKCMLKSQGISIIAADKSKIAVANEANLFKLYVKEGQVDYVINSNARKIAFFTPQGTYSVAEVIFNASTGSVIKGSVVVDSEGKTEITVTEGQLVFTTADGIKTVNPNSRLVLAQTPPANDDKAAAAGGGTSPGVDPLTTGLLVAAAVAAGFIIFDNSSGSSDTGGSGGVGGGGDDGTGDRDASGDR